MISKLSSPCRIANESGSPDQATISPSDFQVASERADIERNMPGARPRPIIVKEFLDGADWQENVTEDITIANE